MRIQQYNDFTTICTIPQAEIEKIDIVVLDQPKETLENFYKRTERKPEVLCNCGFFALNTGNTVFELVDEGKTISQDDRYKWGLGIIRENELCYCSRDYVCRDFVSAYPPLLLGGEPIKTGIGEEIDYKARRTAVGWNDNKVCIMTVDLPGMKFWDMQCIFVDLGCYCAVNFDGGGSTRMLVNGKVVSKQEYSRPVDNAFAVYLKEPNKTIYRVQIGAFSRRENAEGYLATVKSFSPDAYIRQIDGLYKIQAGAFAVKENAVKYRDGLRAAGFVSAFITT